MAAGLISIIGPPAAGKTTLAEWLARALSGLLLREDYAGNPFLEDFYLGRRELALPAQLYFLFSRLSQMHSASWPTKGAVVSDYGFCQDAVYAERNLSGDELEFYRRLEATAAGQVKPPDVLIRLDASEPILLARIAERGRRHEKAFSQSFLADLRAAYSRLVNDARCPVIAVDVGQVDLREDAPRKDVLIRVKRALSKTGRRGRGGK